jgi:Zn-dependent metalloprotease
MKITKFLLISLFVCAIFGIGFFWIQNENPESNPYLSKLSQGEGSDSLHIAPPASRDVSSIPNAEQKTNRQPKSQQRWDEFVKKSEGKWKIKKNEAGFITKLSESSFPLGTRAAVVGAERFLKEYGPSLFALDLEDLALKQNNQEEQATQLIYEQSIAGFPVFGSRLNLFIDREGNLIHVSSDLFSGARPNIKATINPSDSAKIVRAALIDRLENQYGAISSDAYPEAEFERLGVLGYRLHRGSISFVYRYQIVLNGDHQGDFEVMVDAALGQIVLFKDLSRK